MPQTQITNKEHQLYEYYTQHLLDASIIESKQTQPTQNQQQPSLAQENSPKQNQ